MMNLAANHDGERAAQRPSGGERTTRRPARAVAGLLVAMATIGLAPAAAGAQEPVAAPQCRTIDFEKAQVTAVATTRSIPPTVLYELTVTGMKPSSNTTVTLEPLTYIRQPEYWGIEVTGCTTGIGLPVLTSYGATYRFTGPLGTCGIEVIGASATEQFDLAGCKRVALATGASRRG